MVTPQQEKGFRLLEKLIRTKYPWIVKLHIKDPEKYTYTISLDMDVNLKRFVDTYDLHDLLRDRFDNDQSYLDHFIQTCWSYMYSIVISSLITKETDEEKLKYATRLNEKIEQYMSLVYSKLPREMVMLTFDGDPEVLRDEAPSLYQMGVNDDDEFVRYEIFESKHFSIGCYTVIPESSRDLLGGV
jgi:hypothetical protein